MPSINVSFVMPISPIVVVQAIKRTPEIQGRFHQLRNARHPVLPHHFLHHLGSHAAEVKTGKRQTFCASLVQDPEHPAKPIFSGTGRAFPADRVQPPKREEHRHLHAHGGGTGGNDKGRHCPVQISAQEHNGDSVWFCGLEIRQSNRWIHLCGSH